jgi:hypothetical protein
MTTDYDAVALAMALDGRSRPIADICTALERTFVDLHNAERACGTRLQRRSVTHAR